MSLQIDVKRAVRGFLILVLTLTLTGLVAMCSGAAQPPAGPDLRIPEWRLLTVPATPAAPAATLACFTQEETRQLLRIQEHARYGLELQTLHAALETQLRSLVSELTSAQAEYAALRAVITERNTHLVEERLTAQALTERYRARLERRRVWPWVALGLGAVLGTALGVGVTR